MCAERFLPDTKGLAHVMPHDLICQLCRPPVQSECKIDSVSNHSIILTGISASGCGTKCCHSLGCVATAYLMKSSIVSMTQVNRRFNDDEASQAKMQEVHLDVQGLN